MLIENNQMETTSLSIGEDQVLKFSQPSYLELPAISKGAIPCLLSKLRLVDIMRILKLIIHDKVISIIGESRNEIYFCIHALTSLIYPFKYPLR